MGESITPTDRNRIVQRQQMRIRTIDVSFAAAVSSARRDLEASPAERDALIETWRAWSLNILEEYAREIEALLRGVDPATAETLSGLRSTLADAIERVRTA